MVASVILAPAVDVGVDGLVHLGQQRGVHGHGDAELGAGQRLPLDGRDVRGEAAPDLEHVRLDRVVVADGVQPGVGVGVEVARLLAAGGVGAQRLEQAHLAGRSEEQLRVRDRGHALPTRGGGEVLRVRALREGVAKVGAALCVAGVLRDALVLAVGRGDVQPAVVEVLGGAGILRNLLQVGRVQADELVTKVHVELEVAHVRVHGDLVRRDGRQVEGAPLVSGELHEDPGLGAVRDDDLVAVVAALLVDNLAQQLHAIARGIGATQHDIGDVVLAETG